MKNKIKTMKSRQPISDEEINRYMNFDDLLRQKDSIIEKRKKIWMLAVVGVLVVVGGIVGLYYLTVPAKKPTDATLTESKRTIEYKNSTSKTDSVADKPEPLAVQKKLLEKSVSHASSKSFLKPEDHNNKNTVERQLAQTQHENVYVQAEPLDGYPELYAWFEKSLVYPKEAVKDSIQGEVTVVFSIDEKGKAQDIHIDNSPGKVFDDEVYRLMGNMPRWKPATYNGHYVRGKISLPLTFEIKKLNSKK